MKKSLLWVVVLVLSVSMVAAFSLYGCKAEEAAEEEVAEEEEAAEEEVAEEEEAAEEEVAEEEEALAEEAAELSGDIVYWSMWNDNEQPAIAINQWIEAYKEIEPNVNIIVTFTGREVMTKVMAARNGGEVVDLVDSANHVLKGSLIKEGISLVMDDALDTPSYEGDVSWRETFIPGTLEQYAADDGTVSIIPYNLVTNGFIYDQKLWGDNGWAVPTTWDELLALCETIKTTSDIAPITQDGGVDFYNDMWFYQIMAKLLGPGAIMAAAEDDSGEGWENPAFKQAIEMERELFDKGYIVEGAGGFTWPAGQALLASGEAAMELCGSWLPNEIKDQVSEDFEWGTFPFPEIAGGVGKITDMESYLIGWAAFNDTEVGPEIVDFLKFCTTVDNQQIFVDGSWNMSAVMGTVVPLELEGFGQALADADTLFSAHDGLPEKYPDFYKNVYLKNHNLAFLGDITPDEFIDLMKNETIEYWENQ